MGMIFIDSDILIYGPYGTGTMLSNVISTNIKSLRDKGDCFEILGRGGIK